MNKFNITVSHRQERGRHNKSIRKNKKVPAIVYGNGQKNLAFSLDVRDAEKCSTKKFENKILTFQSEDSELNGLKVIKKSIVYHKVRRHPIHMDFLSLDMNKVLRVLVDINFQGVPTGVKNEGGILNTTLRQIEIECLPSNILPAIDLDISQLALNQNIHVSDLKFPKNIKILTKLNRTICSLAEAKQVEEDKPEDAAATETKVATEEDKKASSDDKKAKSTDKKDTKKQAKAKKK